MKKKVRIKDLKPGDLFEMQFITYRVTEVSDMVYFTFNSSGSDFKKSLGKNSMMFVWLINPEKKSINRIIRPKAEYSNLFTIKEYLRELETV